MGMVDGTNQFIYVQNEPVAGTDPSGNISALVVLTGTLLIYEIYECSECSRCLNEFFNYEQECHYFFDCMDTEEWIKNCTAGGGQNDAWVLKCARDKMGKSRAKHCAGACTNCFFTMMFKYKFSE
jgi:hypothetical protein